MGRWKATKVMRYIRCINDFMLIYNKSDDLEIVGHADFADNLDYVISMTDRVLVVSGGLGGGGGCGGWGISLRSVK